MEVFSFQVFMRWEYFQKTKFHEGQGSFFLFGNSCQLTFSRPAMYPWTDRWFSFVMWIVFLCCSIQLDSLRLQSVKVSVDIYFTYSNSWHGSCFFLHCFINVPSVALQDGEHDDVEGGIGRVQHLLPRVHTQACHLLQDNSDEMLMVDPFFDTLQRGLFWDKSWENLPCSLPSSLRYIESVFLCLIKSPWLNEGALSQEGVFNIVDEFFLLLAVYIWWQFFDERREIQ